MRVDPEHRQLELALTDILDSMKSFEPRSSKRLLQSDVKKPGKDRLRKGKGGFRKKKTKK